MIIDQHILAMKVGFHGIESLEAIFERKMDEERRFGNVLWGYGGTLCHPLRVVQPFASFAQMSTKVVLIATPSPFVSDGNYATEWSEDGTAWREFTSPRVMDSRFALVLKNLRFAEERLDLSLYEVAIGPSEGKILSEYLRFRVDKAIGRRSEVPASQQKLVSVAAVADLAPPYAILVRR